MTRHKPRNARQEAARRAWLEQARRWPDEPWPCAEDVDDVANRRNDSQTSAYTAKLPADHPDYRDKVAVPTMNAVDSLPVEYRTCVWDFGYVDVYRAWLRRISPAMIRHRAGIAGGRFAL